MTFTIVARCPQTQLLGVCLATSPLGVASRCPHVRGGVAAISSQCHSDWRHGLVGLELAAKGWSPEEILGALKQKDPFFDYRQIGIVTADGRAAAHSPRKGKAYTGHRVGEGFVAMGNGLAGPEVVEAIHHAFATNASLPFLERLVQAIEAGAAAGGEPIGHASAGLIACAPHVERPLIDLRIDMANPLPAEGGDAVRDLRRVFDAYQPLVPYYADYWLDHPDVSAAQYLDMAASRNAAITAGSQ
ncbi:MAG: DUF1028 domain-containing protein [Bosea sp.]|uniref:DUF1028 domain-containing protein n=1 Tax=Bosea sp. (in: a-proteobacteria) TaxID=1871050 RepID=UPI00239486D7|nr:DUF1028 domain-containing protein [Bosea sp. (in: a-proteobacteria)]MCP4737151.1 DUF1028 domain-containing protein [Bosea sp. (in: a-proteobacteria)]